MDQILLEMLKSTGPQSAIFIVGIVMAIKAYKEGSGATTAMIETLKKDIKDSNDALNRLTLATTKLELQMETMTRMIGKVENLEKDTNELFSQVRHIKIRDT